MKSIILKMIRIGPLVSVVTALFSGGHPNHLHAQTADITGSGLNTSIHAGGMTTFIDGGTRPAGGPNLFHSFGSFSVGEGHTALFRNSDGGATSNIFGRVTGGNVSNIFGTIDSATNFPQANLWLFNPAGFLFGQSASLNVGGSVNISTADYLKLTDGNKFFADPSKNSVLSMDPVSAFGFLPSNSLSVPGITVQASDLRVRTGQTLSLVGNAFVDLVGARLTARAGRLNLVSVGPVDGTQGEVIASGSGAASTLSTTGFSKPGSITIVRTNLDTSSTSNMNNSGSIFIRGGEIIIETALPSVTPTIDSTNLGNAGKGGPIDIQGNIILITDSYVKTNNEGFGDGSDIRIVATDSVNLNHSLIFAATGRGAIGDPSGDSGSILVKGKSIALDISELRSQTFGTGKAGSITLTADQDISMSNFSNIFSFTQAGKSKGAGDISLQGRNVTVAAGSYIQSETNSDGNAGTIRVTAAESFTLAAGRYGSFDFGSKLIASTSGLGKGGDIFIEAKNVKLSGGSGLISENQSNGLPGNIQVAATDTVSLSGVETSDLGVNPTQISTQAGGGFDLSVPSGVKGAGSIRVEAKTINLDGGAQILSGTSGRGAGGTITLAAEQMDLKDNAQILSNSALADSTAGGAGRISIQGLSGTESTARILSLEGSTLSTTLGGGTVDTASADITVGSQTVILANGSRITANTTGNASAGSIRLTTKQLSMTPDSTISSDAQSGGVGWGGSILIDGIASNPVTIAGGVIQAQSATNAKAGDINLRGEGDLNLFGTTLSVKNTGIGNAGAIILNSANNLLIRYSQVSTESAEGSGGTIKLTAPNTIAITDSNLTSSVKGQVGSNSGNILIDPVAVVIQDSKISTTANAGAGGLINVAASGAVLVDPNSKLDASAGPAGVSGRVNINSPIQVLSGTLVPLKMAYAQPALLGDRCAADPEGRFSSFVHAGRDGVPVVPGAFAPSPLFVLDQLMSSSRGSHMSNLTAARLGIASVGATSFQYQSACRS